MLISLVSLTTDRGPGLGTVELIVTRKVEGKKRELATAEKNPAIQPGLPVREQNYFFGERVVQLPLTSCREKLCNSSCSPHSRAV